MTDWFGESPVILREILPSHYENWQHFCSFCGRVSIIYYEGKYLCIKCADEGLEEWSEI